MLQTCGDGVSLTFLAVMRCSLIFFAVLRCSEPLHIPLWESFKLSTLVYILTFTRTHNSHTIIKTDILPRALPSLFAYGFSNVLGRLPPALSCALTCLRFCGLSHVFFFFFRDSVLYALACMCSAMCLLARSPIRSCVCLRSLWILPMHSGSVAS